MIIVFCGVPASGKSTIAKTLKEKLQDVYLLVSDDIGARTYCNIMKQVKEKTGRYRYMVIDATFYRKKWRDELGEAVDGRDVVKLVYIHCSPETCLVKNRGRKDSIPEKAVHIIWNCFEKPGDPDVSIDTDELTPEEAVEKILERIKYKYVC